MINISNHPSSKWTEKQRSAVKTVEESEKVEIIDIPFPNVPPNASAQEVRKMAHKLYSDVCGMGHDFVHIMGETSLVYEFFKLWSGKGAGVVSTSERRSVENDDGSKTIIFDFCQFRRIF